jgi:hypothetical protein
MNDEIKAVGGIAMLALGAVAFIFGLSLLGYEMYAFFGL